MVNLLRRRVQGPEQKLGGIREWYIVGWGTGGRKRVDMNYESEQKKKDWLCDQKKFQTFAVHLC